ncbi:MAG: hypothetical protein K6G76_01485 [Lachnospiraceae bacterium]|nr:hypothetical protein [Lachnospiraceae bacterium]
MREWIIGKKQPDDRQLFLWNMIGSGVYALSSMILTYLTIRVIGPEEGGIYAIGLTLAQMFIYIAYYEMRNFEVTDAKNLYTFTDYHVVKIINCILMMLVCAGYVLLKQYDFHKAVVILLVCLYRMLDGYADVYEAQFHKDGRLDLAGKSMAYRTIVSVGVYFVLLIATNNLTFALCGAVISGIISLVVCDICIYKVFAKIKLEANNKAMVGIWKDCFPLFIGMFLWTYLLSASRIAVDDVMTSEYQSYYQVLFMPVSVINLFAGFLIRPSLIPLTDNLKNKEFGKFWKTIGTILLELSVITVVCMAGAYLVGIPVLSIIVGCDLSDYRMLLTFLIFAGGFNAAAYTLYFVLTIYRDRVSIITGFGLSSLLALVISKSLTSRYALWGAAGSYMISVIVLTVIFVLCIIINNKRKKVIKID